MPYKNDDAPAKNGISAGLFEPNNVAYVGKAETTFWCPGRIQIVDQTGFYSTGKGGQTYLANGSYYLADNLNYTYYWSVYKGELPSNAVHVRPLVGAFTFPVVRAKVDGKTKIGYFISPNPLGFFPSENGNEMLSDFEFLVCDPIPKYPCSK